VDPHDIKSLVIPLMAALGLTILVVLVAVSLGFAWD
jgi:hypothetical protein